MVLNDKDHLKLLKIVEGPGIEPCSTPQITFLYSVLLGFP